MTRQPLELRSWTLVTLSFVIGMLVSDFIDSRLQAKIDAASPVVSADSLAIDQQP